MGFNLAIAKPAILKAKEVATIADVEAAEELINESIALTNQHVATITTTLNDIASDSKLTPVEKQSIKREWNTILAEYTSLINQATSFAVSSTNYTNKYNALDSYLNVPSGSALMTNIDITSDINSSTFSNTFKDYYTAKIDLLNALSAKAKSDAANALNVANSKADSTYVENALNSSATSLRDQMAINLGYQNYASLSAAAEAGNTIVSGGKIKTSLIDTRGLIAENISGENIIGKKISGSSITGSVIKTSFIDLDDTVGFLTAYTIAPISYNSSTMLDAVYVEAENNYRLPTSAILHYNTPNEVSGNIYSYNNYSVGVPLRCASARPTVIVLSNQVMCYTGSTTAYNNGAYQSSFDTGTFSIVIGGFSYNVALTGYMDVTVNGIRYTGFDHTFYLNGIQFKLTSIQTGTTYTTGCGWSSCSYANGTEYKTTLTIIAGAYQLDNVFSSGNNLIEIQNMSTRYYPPFWSFPGGYAAAVNITMPSLKISNFGG